MELVTAGTSRAAPSPATGDDGAVRAPWRRDAGCEYRRAPGFDDKPGFGLRHSP